MRDPGLSHTKTLIPTRFQCEHFPGFPVHRTEAKTLL
jgi:hypothetical protein